MKNYEKYKDLVISCIAKDSICDLAREAYGHNSCERRACGDCCEFTAEWLNREYVEIDWAKVEVDTPVLIKKGNNVVNRLFARYYKGHFARYYKGHFARYYKGMVEVYAGGQTSWSTDGGVLPWGPELVMLANTEDIKKYAKQ